MTHRPSARAREVRRLLADARHTEPMPVDVASRLDAVIADLAGQQEVPPPAAEVTDLAARRRRRATTLLVAAAAVVAIGVGVDRLAPFSSSGGSSQDSAASGAASGPSGQHPGQPSHGASGDGTGPQSYAHAPSKSAGSGAGATEGRHPATIPDLPPVRVRSDHFPVDATRARRAAMSQTGATAGDRNGASRPAFDCQPADWGRGRVVPVRYDGLPAVLVLRPATGDSQVVDLFRCGTTDLLRTTTLPAR
ncbi:hypothetical protein [Nocardioides panaciterrulae]|uniref:Uncharacterized protein n=1 Tax=Nocardioides panaciterrulae TaxID=661492 RepID=A0A7Y9J961_9ACTN|nr:hypothetical protein [Nocardioides panaciterrulae]NYD39998.1 hypothetical protein [Nocardioides panaciterrulae]